MPNARIRNQRDQSFIKRDIFDFCLHRLFTGNRERRRRINSFLPRIFWNFESQPVHLIFNSCGMPAFGIGQLRLG